VFYFSSKRRKNDEISKVKKSHDDEMEEGETTGNETTTNGDINGSSTSKRVPLSLEEMLERNKKEQEATAKVIISIEFFV
jgi:hypothetical protein